MAAFFSNLLKPVPTSVPRSLFEEKDSNIHDTDKTALAQQPSYPTSTSDTHFSSSLSPFLRNTITTDSKNNTTNFHTVSSTFAGAHIDQPLKYPTPARRSHRKNLESFKFPLDTLSTSGSDSSQSIPSDNSTPLSSATSASSASTSCVFGNPFRSNKSASRKDRKRQGQAHSYNTTSIDHSSGSLVSPRGSCIQDSLRTIEGAALLQSLQQLDLERNHTHYHHQHALSLPLRPTTELSSIPEMRSAASTWDSVPVKGESTAATSVTKDRSRSRTPRRSSEYPSNHHINVGANIHPRRLSRPQTSSSIFGTVLWKCKRMISSSRQDPGQDLGSAVVPTTQESSRQRACGEHTQNTSSSDNEANQKDMSRRSLRRASAGVSTKEGFPLLDDLLPTATPKEGNASLLAVPETFSSLKKSRNLSPVQAVDEHPLASPSSSSLPGTRRCSGNSNKSSDGSDGGLNLHRRLFGALDLTSDTAIATRAASPRSSPFPDFPPQQDVFPSAPCETRPPTSNNSPFIKRHSKSASSVMVAGPDTYNGHNNHPHYQQFLSAIGIRPSHIPNHQFHSSTDFQSDTHIRSHSPPPRPPVGTFLMSPQLPHHTYHLPLSRKQERKARAYLPFTQRKAPFSQDELALVLARIERWERVKGWGKGMEDAHGRGWEGI